ncbi:hypothetical protein KI688_006617 [Linnemannia hyalina]|uniref:Uncharacterized protein n=1 Tax=Linnemannia hyalina TaxID=64524 RepID=A0A9P7XJ85_9FUNG|nr:hypothetical protein KI688_006617 [Linnemannia hyalina]
MISKLVSRILTRTALRELMDRTDSAAQGNIFERYMMTVFSETFKSRRLSEWPHQPPILEMSPDLAGEVEIMKLHQSSSKLYKKLWEKALATVSASCIQDHAKNFRNFCPDNIFISMVVAYPMICAPKLPPAIDVPEKDAHGMQQVVIRVSDTNFGQIFPKEHVKFIDRLKNAGKRAADDVDSDDEDRPKKLRI